MYDRFGMKLTPDRSMSENGANLLWENGCGVDLLHLMLRG